MRRITYCLLLGIAFALPSNETTHAAQRIYYATGTGFFVSANGDFITNEHVVRHCRKGSITLRSDAGTDSPARLIALDGAHDLALLRAQQSSGDGAPLAAVQSSIRKGDNVMVIGYPSASENLRDYKVEMAEIIDVAGPQGEERWLQFSDAAQHGNSGGPLLDDAGNVIGVVTGKSELFSVDRRTRQQTLISTSDIAVALPILKQFLTRNAVRYRSADSRTRRHTDYVEKRAASFTARVSCITHSEPLR